MTIQNPKAVNVICFFLNQPTNNLNFVGKFSWTLISAVSLYSSVPPYDSLEFIGAINDSRPSDIFHPGWSLNPTVNIHSELKLVIQMYPIDKIETCVKIQQETDLNKDFAKKVAQNLFNFLQSFNRVSLLPLFTAESN